MHRRPLIEQKVHRNIWKLYLHDIRVYYAYMYVTLIVCVWWSCPQFRLIAMKVSYDKNSLILLIYSLEEGSHHLFQTVLIKNTNPFWQNDCSSIPNSHYKWNRFKHHDESELKTCLMHARRLFYIATCISEFTKVMTSLSCTFKTWLQCVVYIFVGLLQGYGIHKEIKI